ncbi:PREDICTED: nuclear transcription factor Y subunit B-8-like [Tarenaya hassleriana]|uniref:nuclear transcription factor Y subunit B-8-like n=1 Tax=Tarenaya hassleriana TaxID=28532 RepID=UPI0008FD8CD6|nr:PREDICTED: nuclear transcription factor Y subunit B-8-like [Tarenaya hassleriana]
MAEMQGEGASPGDGGGHESGEDQSPRFAKVRGQDRLLPVANVSRIMKRALPPNAKIAKDVRDIVQECVSEFVSLITSEASHKCLAEKRKTLNGDDVLGAMATFGFEAYIEPLRIYLMRYRDMEGPAKGGDPNATKEAQPIQSTELPHQASSSSQDLAYGDSLAYSSELMRLYMAFAGSDSE